MHDTGMTEREIEQLVFVREDPVAADLAIVFGAACEQEMRSRTLRGVELRQQGHATRLLVTGGGVLAQTRPEAQRMAEIVPVDVLESRDALCQWTRDAHAAALRSKANKAKRT